MNIKNNYNDLSSFLAMKPVFVSGDINLLYSEGKVRKKDGSQRLIKKPDPKLKKIQRKVLKDVLMPHIEIHSTCYGLGKKRDGKYELLRHISYYDEHMILLDIEKFFPSINYRLVKSFLTKKGFSKKNANLLSRLITRDKCVPQGVPTSSFVACAILFDFDKKIAEVSEKEDAVYTRYIDDIKLSGKIDSLLKIEKVISSELNGLGLRLKDSKRKVFKPNKNRLVSDKILLTENQIKVRLRYSFGVLILLIKQLIMSKLVLTLNRLRSTENWKTANTKVKGKLSYCYYMSESRLYGKPLEWLKELERKV